MTAATAPYPAPAGAPAGPRRRPRLPGVPPPAGPARLLAAAGVVVAAVLSVLTVFAGSASAHAALTGSDPKDGAVVATAPKAVTLTFSEQVSLGRNAIRVLAPDNKRVDTGKITDVSTGSTASYRTALRPGIGDGTYTVAWQAVSADTHPVAGAFTFSVGAPSRTEASVTGQNAGGGLVGALYGIARYVSYAGFTVLVGGAAFVLVCWPRGASVRPVQRLVVRAWTAFTAATLALLLLRGPYTGSGKLADVLDLSGLRDVLGTKEGAALVSRLLLLGAAAVFVAVLFGAYARRGGEGADRAERRDLAFGLGAGGAAVSAGLAATWSLSEHASTGIQTGLAMPVDMVHLLAMACWLGGLAALLTALYRAPSVDAAAVRRFSALAFWSVAALVASGLYQAWRQIGTFSALASTSYGRLLMIKVGLVVVIVVIAYFSRRWTARLAEAPGASASGAGAGAAEPLPVGAAAASGAPGAGAGSGAGAAARAPVPAGGGGSGTGPGAGEEAGAGAGASGTGPGAGADAKPRAGSGASGAGTVSGAKSPVGGGGSGGESDAGSETGACGVQSRAAGGGSGAAGATARAGAGGERAAQLARQRAAVDTARTKRVRDADPARGGLRRSVLAEAAVAVVVLVFAVILSDTEPARTAQAAAHTPAGAAAAAVPKAGPVDLSLPFDTGGPKGRGVAEFYLEPARAGGQNLMHLYVNGPDNRPLDVPQVKASLTLKSRGIGPLPIAPERFAPGHWAAEHVQIPMPGTWQLALTVRTSDIDETTVYKNITIG
ncbi:copper resistance CopC/CopD family protein [Streptomyces tremellae]|uniref:Copper transport protein n=1 Tax=Streptomyces tremellae TaxID=1124239 RepID=A0ABP7FIY1_9ACTN